MLQVNIEHLDFSFLLKPFDLNTPDMCPCPLSYVD